MFFKFIKKIIFSKRVKSIKKKKSFYINENFNQKKIKNHQLEKFNRLWKKCFTKIEYYKRLKSDHKLPEKILELNEIQSFPILTKEIIINNQDLIFKNLKSNYVETGGSTGVPAKFPTGQKDAIFAYANQYTGRSWWEIEPFDKSVVFWGHSHLFKINKILKFDIVRKLKDQFVNTLRFNAYDMSEKNFLYYIRSIQSFNPIFIIGYSSIISQISKYIIENNIKLHISNLKCIIATSEIVTDLDRYNVRKAFDVDLANEYGTAETGVIGYSKPNNNKINFFWDSFYCYTNFKSELLVTTLDDKTFPLINYSSSDLVNEPPGKELVEVSQILGRTKDFVKIKIYNETHKLSAILLQHAMQSYEGVYKVQFNQLEDYKVNVKLILNDKVNINKLKHFFIENINIKHKGVRIDSFVFNRVNDIEKSNSGKHLIIK